MKRLMDLFLRFEMDWVKNDFLRSDLFTLYTFFISMALACSLFEFGNKGLACFMVGLLLFWERYVVVRLYEEINSDNPEREL